ncbi:MAG TPA: VWA domain-containing protein [Terracidiphilus sp.]|nr:VWA domain-containing protein [Terracidiphilus sp.]
MQIVRESARSSQQVLCCLIGGSLLSIGARFLAAQVASHPLPVAPIGEVQSDHHISISVVVDDKMGHPIPGLKADDFTLLDNKQPQKLTGFRGINLESSKADPVQVIIAIDMINTGFGEVAWERQELAAFLKEDGGKLANPTSIAVFSDRGLKVGQDPSQDGNALIAGFDSTESALRIVNRSGGFYGLADMLEMSLDQLSQLAEYEAAQPGRKLMLVISPGWPLLPLAGVQEDSKQRNWVFRSVVQFSNGLREGNITLYCLDPFILGRTNPYYYQGYLKPVSVAGNAEYPDLALQVLAEHSGGQVLVMSHDITGELNTAVRDASASYELTFDPAQGDRTNEFHALQVKVDKPGVKVRTTAGYYAHVDLSTGGNH